MVDGFDDSEIAQTFFTGNTRRPVVQDAGGEIVHLGRELIDLRDAVRAARAIVEDYEGESVRSLTLDMVRRMLARGFRAGSRFKPDGTLEPWPDQSPAFLISRIEAKWNELGHDPVSDNIAWFERVEAK